MITINLFILGWLITSWLTFISIVFWRKLNNFICQKCITFWIAILYCLINNYEIIPSIFISSTSSFLAFIYEELYEKWNK